MVPPRLGYPVTTQQFDWLSLVVELWGDQWTIPDVAYEWPNGRKFDSSDNSDSGVYERT